RALMAVGWLVISAAAAWGQSARGYAGVGFGSASFGASSIHGPSPSTTYTNSPEKGRIPGLVTDGGFFFTRKVAVGIEAWFPFERRTITQEHSYLFNPYRRISSFRER